MSELPKRPSARRGAPKPKTPRPSARRPEVQNIHLELPLLRLEFEELRKRAAREGLAVEDWAQRALKHIAAGGHALTVREVGSVRRGLDDMACSAYRTAEAQGPGRERDFWSGEVTLIRNLEKKLDSI